MDIRIEKVTPNELKPKPEKGIPLGFGKYFTDYMFIMDYEEGKGWFNPRIKKFEDLPLSPAAKVLHYGQEIFEGLKGYKRVDGKLGLFRAECNFERLNRSAHRLCMPPVPVEDQQQVLFELLRLERDWFPDGDGESLYIRPTMIGTEPALGVKESSSYMFYIILSPSGAYFTKGFVPVSVYVCDKYVRAIVGGVGEAKTGGNYAASLLAGREARGKGCEQVLWLDGKELKYIQEVGAMNICFVFNGDTVVTSDLNGAILDGVTRSSVITLSRDFGYRVDVRPISIDEVIDGIKSKRLTECFGCGTAAVISPVGRLLYKDIMYEINTEAGPVSKQIYKELTDIQWGRIPDRFDWTTIVE